MDDGFGVLLMSQNHGYDGDLAFINGWNGIYGYATLPSRFRMQPQPHLADVSASAERWASSRRLRSNFIGNPSGANFGADGTNAAERYTGSGSSGELPISFGMPTGRQYCGIGYFSSAFAGRGPSFAAVSATSRTRWALTWASCPGVTARHRTRTSASSRASSHSFGTGKVWNVGYRRGHERDGFGLRLDEPCGRAEQHPGLAG
ncbi:MAG: hypothetical protein R3F46_03675 [bacterium]